MKRSIWIGLAVIVIVLVIIFVTRSGEPEDQGPTLVSMTDGQNTVVVNDQDPGTSVNIPLTVLVNSGYVVVHEDADGAPGAVIGVSGLLIGSNENVVVTLTRANVPGETLHAMLHTDDGDGLFTFPGPDVPLKDTNDQILTTMFEIIGEAILDGENGEAMEEDGEADEPQAVAVNELDMVSGNFSFNPSGLTLKKNQPVKISFKNSGTHTFTVDELGVNVSLTGSSGTAEFTPTKSGTFEYYCAVSGHRERGMFGSLQVN